MKSEPSKGSKIFWRIFTVYMVITLFLFFLELVFKFGNPVFVIGQAFFVFGLLTIYYYTFAYLITLLGLYACLASLNIWQIDPDYLGIVIVCLFPFVFFFLLFSKWNDKRRIIRKGGEEVEAIYKGTDPYGRKIFEYTYHNQKYKNIQYERNNTYYRLNTKVKITANANRIYVPSSKKEFITLLSLFLIFLSIAILVILLMLFG